MSTHSLSFPLRAKRGLERTLQECHFHQASYWAASLLSPYVAFASDLTCAQVLTTAQDFLATVRKRGLLPLVGNFPRSLMRLMTLLCFIEKSLVSFLLRFFVPAKIGRMFWGFFKPSNSVEYFRRKGTQHGIVTNKLQSASTLAPTVLASLFEKKTRRGFTPFGLLPLQRRGDQFVLATWVRRSTDECVSAYQRLTHRI